MSLLENIASTVINVANVISTVVGADVVICDDQPKLVAVSEGYFKRKGTEQIWRRYVDYIFEKGSTMVIDNPGFHLLCKGCPREGNCNQKLEIVAPILYNSKIIGYISLISFNLNEKEQLMNKKNEIISFLEEMSKLIVNTIAQIDIYKEYKKLSRSLQTTISLVSYGLITCNDKGIVINCNEVASTFLGLQDVDIIGKSIRMLLPDSSAVTKIFDEKTNIAEEEWRKNLRGKWCNLLICGKTICNESGKHEGAVFTLQKEEEIHRLIYKIGGKEIDYTLDDIIGPSTELESVRKSIVAIAPSDSTVLIRGESGTGKELVARTIHGLSPRRNKPFIAINCCAIPDALLESELFGYEDGAFTGAKRGGKAGKLEIANGGTLFLDEIGDMPLHLQVKLLRILQEKIVERIGGCQQVKLDIRIIAATNQNLEEKIQNKEFREDLYYRINVIPLVIPPLRERQSDIIPLCEYFIKKYNNKFNRKVQGIAEDFRRRILEYDWPGNVRELENAIEYAMNVEKDNVLNFESLPAKIKNIEESNNIMLKQQTGQVEKKLISKAIELFGNTEEGKLKAAELLGISRATLYRKIKRLNIDLSYLPVKSHK